MVGRHRKAGHRYPSGKLKKPTGDPIVPAAWARVRTDAAKLINDDRLASELGRLSFHRELTDAQAAAGFRVAEIYAGYEKAKGKRRSLGSPSYEQEFRGDGGFPEELVAVKDAAEKPNAITLDDLSEDDPLYKRMAGTLAAEQAFLALQDELDNYGPRARDLLETLCVDNCTINPQKLDAMRWLLNRLAVFFGTSGSRKKAKRQAPRKTGAERAAAPAPVSRVTVRHPPIEAVVLRTMLKAARPDMDAEQIEAAVSLAGAVKERELFRRTKEKT
jgi:hypothetical protein